MNSPAAQTTARLPHTTEKERIATLDILRGFALCGILLVDILLRSRDALDPVSGLSNDSGN